MKWWHWLLIGLLLIAATGGAVVVYSRGFRNNNPGNIRPLSGGRQWQGQVGVDRNGSAEGYVIFDTMANGVRAVARDLKVKISRGLNTIEKIIPVYAPAGDANNVPAYIAAVEQTSGVNRSQPIGLQEFPLVVMAILRHEIGAVSYGAILQSDIDRGIASA